MAEFAVVPLPSSSSAETLAYIRDMLFQLGRLAEKIERSELAAILLALGQAYEDGRRT